MSRSRTTERGWRAAMEHAVRNPRGMTAAQLHE